MRKILVILGLCLLIPLNSFGMDKSLIGFYGNSEYGKNSDGISNCGIYLDDEVEGWNDDVIQMICKQKNKFDFNFGYFQLKNVNKNEFNIILKNKIIGKMKVIGNEITINSNLVSMDSLLDDGLVICNGKESHNERICKRGNKKQFEEYSKLISGMKFKKEF